MLACEFNYLLTLVPRSLNPRQLPAPNLQTDPAGQRILEGVTSDVDALAEVFDKIERSVAEDSLTGEAIKSHVVVAPFFGCHPSKEQEARRPCRDE
jgi:hypothetical protein